MRKKEEIMTFVKSQLKNNWGHSNPAMSYDCTFREVLIETLVDIRDLLQAKQEEK